MNRRMGLLRDILTELMNYATLFGLLISVFSFAGREQSVWRLLLPAIVPMYYLLLRRKVSFFPVFILLHLLTFVLPLLLIHWTVEERLAFAAVIVIQFLLSIMAKAGNKKMNFNVVLPIILLTAAFLITSALQMERTAQTVIIVGIFYAAMYYIRYYLDRLERFEKVNGWSTQSIPMKRMVFSGGMMVAAYTVFAFAVLLFSSHWEWIGKVSRFVAGVFIELLYMLISLLPIHYAEKGDDIPLITVARQAAEGSAGENYMEGFMQTVFFILLAAVLTHLVWKFYKFICRLALSFHLKISSAEEKQKYQKDEIIKVEKKEQEKNEKLPFFPTLPSEKIRKLFYSFLMKQQNMPEEFQTALQKKTARECAAYLEGNQDILYQSSLAELVRLYEKARYAKERCQNEDVKRVKECIKILKEAPLS